MDDPTPSLQSLATMALGLARSTDVREVFETATGLARAGLGAASVSIGRADMTGGVVRMVTNSGDLAPTEERWPVDEVYPIDGDARLTSSLRDLRTSTHSLDDPDCDPGERRLLQRLGKGSSLATPIMVDGQPWGEFFATRHVGDLAFHGEAVAYAEVVAAIMSSAVSWTLRASELQTLAFQDDLTGLYNRRGLNDRASRLFEDGAEQSRTVAIVAVDLNNLKRVNDTEGHARGDQEIRRSAFALLRGFSALPTSVVARVGGDEFAVLLADDDVVKAEETINDVCRRVAADNSPISLAAGIATAELAHLSTVAGSRLFAAADKALYAAKRARSPVAVVAETSAADGLTPADEVTSADDQQRADRTPERVGHDVAE
ncbi:MAG: sensor domain-containing diguanylate cyclase [Aeromicrobium sp.]